jgi:hypothetical protein
VNVENLKHGDSCPVSQAGYVVPEPGQESETGRACNCDFPVRLHEFLHGKADLALALGGGEA